MTSFVVFCLDDKYDNLHLRYVVTVAPCKLTREQALPFEDFTLYMLI